MNIIVIGGDGYIGWPLSMRLARLHPDSQITIVDSGLRRQNVEAAGAKSLVNIESMETRVQSFQSHFDIANIDFLPLDITDTDQVYSLFRSKKPQIIYHLGHQPSAPYSMESAHKTIKTVTNNEVGNLNILWAMRDHCPQSHLVKLGSFGAYAQPGTDIPEGYFHVTYKGKTSKEKVPFPRAADDFYHITKINDSNFVYLACNKWGLKVTDVMQSTVFGMATQESVVDKKLATRYDYDDVFGTVLNRFVVSAISGRPLTVYGSGEQRTGIMGLNDCIDVLSRVSKDHVSVGEHRVINNVTENHSINELAHIVESVATDFGLKIDVDRSGHNPRLEDKKGHDQVVVETDYIKSLGIDVSPIAKEVHKTIEFILPYQKEVQHDLIAPKYKW